jgi:hypothetical protein
VALDQLGDGQLLEGWYRTLGAGDAMAAPGVTGGVSLGNE